jgi:hypothetical protein
VRIRQNQFCVAIYNVPMEDLFGGISLCLFILAIGTMVTIVREEQRNALGSTAIERNLPARQCRSRSACPVRCSVSPI